MSHSNPPANNAGQTQSGGQIPLGQKFLCLWTAADWAAWMKQCKESRKQNLMTPAPHTRRQAYRLGQEGVPKNVRRFVNLPEASYLIDRLEREKHRRGQWRAGQRAAGTYKPKWIV